MERVKVGLHLWEDDVFVREIRDVNFYLDYMFIVKLLSCFNNGHFSLLLFLLSTFSV